MRELVLDSSGITLADVFTSGGEVVMGALRWEKERAERTAATEREDAAERLRLRLEAEALELEGRLRSLQHELVAKRADMARLLTASQKQVVEASDSQTARYRMRWGDPGYEPVEATHD